MKTFPSRLSVGLAFAVAGCALSFSVSSQSFPAKPVTVYIPGPAGSAGDTVVRLLGRKFAENTGQNLIVDNRPGGRNIIAANAAKAAPPDGYSMYLGHLGSQVLDPMFFSNYPIDPIKEFKPVTTVLTYLGVLLVPGESPVKNLVELVSYSKTKPGGLFHGGGQGGSGIDLLVLGMLKRMGVVVQNVGYKGYNPAVADLMTGRVDVVQGNLAGLDQHLDSGRLRAIAIDAPSRFEYRPNVPTFAEQGHPDYKLQYWLGLFVPAGTPDAPIAALQREFVKALSDPAVRKQMLSGGSIPGGISPEEFGKVINADRERFDKLIKEVGIKPEPL